MITKRILRILLIAAIALLTFNISPGTAEKLTFEPLMSPEVSPTDMGTTFSYQGRLLEGITPADGPYDFQFRLYDEPTAGIQIGTTQTLANQTVSNGLFMVDVDFGDGVFTGFESWLEISVRPYSIDSEPYTVLVPRQQINPAPYATFARTIYRKTLVVKPVTLEGSDRDNGQVLLDTIAGIFDNAYFNTYLIKIEPGTYDLADQSLTMLPYVDIEGSGEGVTIITGKGSGNANHATVIGAANSEIRMLTIESVGYRWPEPQENYATALSVPYYESQVLQQVTLLASNGLIVTRGIYADGYLHDNGTPDPSDDWFEGSEVYLNSVSINVVYNADIPVGAAPTVRGIHGYRGAFIDVNDSSITTEGGSFMDGVFNLNAIVRIETSTISGYGENVTEYAGIHNLYPFASLILRNSVISYAAIGEEANFYGIRNEDAGPIQLFDSEIDVTGTGGRSYGIYHGSSIDPGQLALNNIKIHAYGMNLYNYGVYCSNTPLIIHNSHIYAEGGNQTIGLGIFDGGYSPIGEITQTVIEALGAEFDGNPNPLSNTNTAVRIWTDGVYTFLRDTLQTQSDIQGSGDIEGGVGLVNDGGNITLENTTINDKMQQAYIGIAHRYYVETNNQLWVNNSEVYACNEMSCTPVVLIPASVMPPAPPVIWISSSLLWGGTIVTNFPFLQCMWVTDETYNGWGYAADGTDPANYICP